MSPFFNWGVFAPKDQTGVGRMADDMISVLGVGWRFIAESTHMKSAPAEVPREVVVRRSDSKDRCETLLEHTGGLEGLFFFERLDWNFDFFRVCKRHGVRTVCIPMWEWFAYGPRHRPLWQELVDFFVCPNAMCERVLRGFGIQNLIQLPWCLDLEQFPERQVTGPARLFIHNAGLVDGQDRKGTRETIRAFMRTTRDDIRLIVRLQRATELPPVDDRVEIRVQNLKAPADLYREGDVAIQPSKMEGIGFMVLEPFACGLPTLTLDYPPMNELVTDAAMLIHKLPFKRRAVPTVWVPHAHLRLPSIRDLARRIEWCASNDLSLISKTNRQRALGIFNRTTLCKDWTEALTRVVS